MKPLRTNCQSLIWLCMCPQDHLNSPSQWRELIYAIYTAICLGTLITCFSGDLTFCIKFVTIDLGRSMFSFMFLVAEFTAIYMGFIAMFLLRHKIDTIFKTLATIYNACKQMIEKLKIEFFFF